MIDQLANAALAERHLPAAIGAPSHPEGEIARLAIPDD
jgi:hypothetical protein